MGMKNMKGGEVCSTAGGRITAEGDLHPHLYTKQRQTTANLFMSYVTAIRVKLCIGIERKPACSDMFG